MSTATRSLAVACVQLRAHESGRFADRWPAILARIAEATRAGAELVVVPEGTVPNYVIGEFRPKIKMLADSAADILALSKQANATIVIGGARYRASGELLNSAWVVTPDGIAGYADKCFLWHFDRKWFVAADVLEPIDTPVGRLGVLICADGRIPTIGSTLIDRGAELLVMPTAWVTSGRDPSFLENLQADLFVNVRARENRVPLVAANKVGVEYGSVAYCGKSAIVDANGAFVARASERAEETIHARIAIGSPPARKRGDVEVSAGTDLPSSLRIAITPQTTGAARTQLDRHAELADARLILGPEDTTAFGEIGVVRGEAMWDPALLVAARLGGTRLFVWHADAEGDWVTRLARVRAAELRAYLVVFDAGADRAFAVDPDGVVICGTFDDFRLAAFTFDRARTDAWTIAPFTNVADGLRLVDRLAVARV